LLTSRLTVSADGRALTPQWSTPQVLPDRQSLFFPVRFPLDRRPGALTVSTRLFPYDPQHQTFVNVYEGEALTQAILDYGRSDFEYFTGTRQGVWAVTRKFLPLGIHHILIGPTHLIFLIGLLLLACTIRHL